MTTRVVVVVVVKVTAAAATTANNDDKAVKISCKLEFATSISVIVHVCRGMKLV